jgi:hypothetical protein
MPQCLTLYKKPSKRAGKAFQNRYLLWFLSLTILYCITLFTISTPSVFLLLHVKVEGLRAAILLIFTQL